MKKIFSLIFKFIILCVTAWGLYLNFKLFTFKGAIVYFTILSNVFVFITFLILFIRELLNKKNLTILKGMATISIIVTMLVFEMLLSTFGDFNLYSDNLLSANLLHLVVPVLVVFDYILFDEKGKMKSYYPFLWSIPLIVYQIFIVIYSSLGGLFQGGEKYPYFYLNVEKYGVTGCFINCLVIYLVCLALNYIFYLLDINVYPKIKYQSKKEN